MATTPEGKVKRQVTDLLDKYDCYRHMPVVTGYGTRTLDIIGCYRGRFFAVETKRGALEMTPQQEKIAADMRAAGGTVFLVNQQTGLDALREWLDDLR